MLKVQNYSNTEYLIKSWIPITTGFISFIVIFSHNLYIFIKPNSNVIYLPAWLRILTFFLWQSAPPLLVFRSIQTFAFKRIRIAMDNNIIVDFKKQITKTFLAWKSYVLQVTEPLNLTMIGLIHDIVHFRDKQRSTPITNEESQYVKKFQKLAISAASKIKTW